LGSSLIESRKEGPPNWCLNKLTVRGPEDDVANFRKPAVGHSPWPRHREGEGDTENLLNFFNLVPIPPEVLTAGYDSTGANWERENWGCTHGAFETSIIDDWEDALVYDFQTAWSPPIEFLEHAAKQWPALTFILHYQKPGMGFEGIAKFEGETAEDHCIDY